MSRRAVIIAAVAVLAATLAVGLLLGAGRDGDGERRAADTETAAGDRTPRTGSDAAGPGRDDDTDASGSGDRATTTTTDPPPEDPGLRDLLLPDALPGFERADDELGAGPLDLEGAARAEPDVEAERALLETRGFLRGLSRAWQGPDDDVVLVVAYEFAEPAGATAYLADGREAVEARGATPFEVDAPAGAIGFTSLDETSEGTFTGHAVAFARDRHWFLVVVGSSRSSRTPDDARALAAQQAARAEAALDEG